MTEQVFEAITAAITNSAWGTVEPSYVPALARDIMYDLERAGFEVVEPTPADPRPIVGYRAGGVNG